MELLGLQELKDYIGVSRPTIERHVRAGTMPPPIKVCGRIKWDKKEIDDWLEHLKSHGKKHPSKTLKTDFSAMFEQTTPHLDKRRQQ